MTPQQSVRKLSEIVFDEVIYPRRGHLPLVVARYAEVLEEIEASHKYIAIAADNKLLDGKHRWLAYQKRANGNDPEIPVFVYPVTTPHEQLQIAARLNSDHGVQLSGEEKEDTAKALYAYGLTQDTIAKTLHVATGTVNDWLKRTIRENRQRRDRKILAMWLACATQTTIAEACQCSQPTVTQVVEDFISKFSEKDTDKSFLLATHATDFDLPQKNIWNGHDKTPHSNFPGSTEPRWLDNLLYLYTQPFDIVVDPFAGSGSTIDVCQKRLRRYFVSDRRPIVERAHEIRQHDITTGLPSLPTWRDVRLVYLDPPYWKQVEGTYSQDPTDLANMSLDDFNTNLSTLIKAFSKKLSSGAKIALIIQPTHWKAPEHAYIDHALDMIARVKLPVTMRIACPLDTPGYTAYLEWCLAERQLLVLNREIVVWTVP